MRDEFVAPESKLHLSFVMDMRQFDADQPVPISSAFDVWDDFLLKEEVVRTYNTPARVEVLESDLRLRRMSIVNSKRHLPVALSFFTAVLFLMPLSNSRAQSNPTPPPPLGRLVDIGGRHLHLYCQGSGSPTVIVENGNSGFSIDWALVQPEVAKVTRICTYDRAGYAWSDIAPANGSVTQIIDDLHLLLRAAGERPPYVLVGASIGGLYVQAYQRRYPEQIVGIVMDDPSGEEGLRYMLNGKDTHIYEMNAADMRRVFKPLLNNPPHYDAPAKIEEPFDRLPPDLQTVRLWAWQKYFAEMDIINDLITADGWRQEFIALRRRRLTSTHPLGNLPLIVLGRHQEDEITRQNELHTLESLSTSGKLIIAENSGHAIELYNPELVTRSIVEVVRSARRRR